VPWLYDDEAVDTVRFFTRLKSTLMPYLFGAAIEAHQTGTPVMRAMLLEFPDDPACATLDRQYLLGESLLVAPVFSYDDTVEFYVPAGRWTSFLSGEEIEGPRWVRQKHGFLSVPLLVRPNSVIPVGSIDSRPDYDYADGVTFRVFALDDGGSASCPVPNLDGSNAGSVTVTRSGSRITASVEGRVSNWSLQIGDRRVVAEGDAATVTLEV
jgi:alpha-D-xyloside xylohydrolase